MARIIIRKIGRASADSSRGTATGRVIFKGINVSPRGTKSILFSAPKDSRGFQIKTADLERRHPRNSLQHPHLRAAETSGTFLHRAEEECRELVENGLVNLIEPNNNCDEPQLFSAESPTTPSCHAGEARGEAPGGEPGKDTRFAIRAGLAAFTKFCIYL